MHVTDWERRQHRLSTIDEHLKRSVAEDIGKAVSDKVQVNHFSSDGFHIYEGEIAVLDAREYRIMVKELADLRERTKKLEHLLYMQEMDRA